MERSLTSLITTLTLGAGVARGERQRQRQRLESRDTETSAEIIEIMKIRSSGEPGMGDRGIRHAGPGRQL